MLFVSAECYLGALERKQNVTATTCPKYQRSLSTHNDECSVSPIVKTQDTRETSDAPGHKEESRPSASEAKRKFSGSRK